MSSPPSTSNPNANANANRNRTTTNPNPQTTTTTTPATTTTTSPANPDPYPALSAGLLASPERRPPRSPASSRAMTGWKPLLDRRQSWDAQEYKHEMQGRSCRAGAGASAGASAAAGGGGGGVQAHRSG